ncbi:MAG TPA: SDR family oxidoreductase [Gaiellaceae bacterium]|nr:SDR family oxidoreductase [Gaiellaceae bacterium]
MSRRALVTGGGRGIGANVARALAADGWEVVVTGRTADQVEAVAAEIGGRALVGDVSRREDVERWFAEAGEVDLLVNNAGIIGPQTDFLGEDAEAWLHVFEVNVFGAFLCCRAAVPGMLARGGGRIVNVSSGAAYLPGAAMAGTAYGPSKAALHRFSELLAARLSPQGIFVFSISPGLVKTELTAGFPDDAPWTPDECAPRLVVALAGGGFDALAGRYLHAEHDPPEALRERVQEILDGDWNAIRLRRP